MAAMSIIGVLFLGGLTRRQSIYQFGVGDKNHHHGDEFGDVRRLTAEHRASLLAGSYN